MAPRTIRPDQIADPDVLFANGPGADLNINCSKRLIGLTYLAEKVEGRIHRGPGPARLRAALALLAGASVSTTRHAFCHAGIAVLLAS